MEDYHATAEITWQEPEVIQRKLELGQALYAANIRFAGVDELWSVTLLLRDLQVPQQELTRPVTMRIGFLFPKEVKRILKKGMHFTICEGPKRTIGSGKILSIRI
jgi:hypothetical protein